MFIKKINKQVPVLIENTFLKNNFSKYSIRNFTKCTLQADIKNSAIENIKIPSIVNNSRYISTSKVVSQSSNQAESPFLVEDLRDQGYAILRLNKAPVNSMSLEFLTQLNIQLDKFENDKSLKGVILTSQLANIFSAGLDIMEMYNPKPDRIRQFWSTLQDFWIKLYGSNKIYIAAITGHSPAGGCLMSISCDYRIMSKGPYKIGLNETLLGITAPFWFKDSMINTIGFRETEKALQLGKLYSPEEALAINLVDELADPKDVLLRAQEEMLKWCKIPQHARELTKSSMRQETIGLLQASKETDIVNFVNYVTKESIQKSLHMYLEALKKPKTKK